jgi:hypothetical protein
MTLELVEGDVAAQDLPRLFFVGEGLAMERALGWRRSHA